jgi:NADH:ubiquinone oxidoreductase subunit C
MTKINNLFLKNTYNLLSFLLKTIPLFLIKLQVNIKENLIIITTKHEYLLNLITFLKDNQLLQFKTLISITAVDYPKNKNRFEINYFLLSYKLNTRIIIKLNTSDILPVPSITPIFKGAN